KAKRIVGDLIKYGEVRRPYYGFEPQELSRSLVEALDIGDASGAVVAEVDPEGPARALLQPGDVITSVDALRVVDQASLRMLLNDRLSSCGSKP
ncbi:MAG: PDZ domain-containing protein, partial [Methylobacterium sp.]